MAFDPAQSLNNYNVYQSGQNGADNRTNQNNQLSGRLQLSNQNHPPKARACNNKNIDGAKSKGFKLGKLVRQTTIKVAYSQNNKSKFFYEAVKNGDVKRVKKWLEAGAEVNYVNGKGITPLCRAAWKGYTDVVKLLLSHPEIDVNKDRPLYWAAKNGHIEIVKLLLSHPEIDVNQANNIGFTPLYWAAKEGHIEIVK
ncbi:MAG: hypothetical protein GY874_14400, partial [Desulfobacteraceae bacterium]|nr:hypothetical protein [Desulfobacteraceae bacterium]